MDKSRKDNIPFIILSERVGEDQMELVRGIKGWTYIKLDFLLHINEMTLVLPLITKC